MSVRSIEILFLRRKKYELQLVKAKPQTNIPLKGAAKEPRRAKTQIILERIDRLKPLFGF
jgi:hypothetical protein